MIRAQVESLGVDSQGDVVLMMRLENDLLLPIGIGALEAHHIALPLRGERPPRPLLPDVFLSTLELLGARPERMEIVDLIEGVFYGRFVLKERGVEYEIDIRPSDGIALALRSGVPILVDEAVAQAAGIREERGGPTPQA